MIDTIVQTLLQGLLLGALYCLFALGQSLMFGVMRLTNTAQGDFIVLAAFGAIALAPLLLMSSLAAAAALLPVAFAAGYALQRWVLNGTLGRDPLPSLVVTFGLSIVIQNGLLELFSADPRSLDSAGFSTRSLALGEFAVGALPLAIFGTALLCTVALQALFDRTAIAFIVIALAGSLQAMRTTVAPSDGPLLLLFAFEAVIIGGMGSFWGTFAGAMVLGLAQQIGFRLDPGWGIWFGHLVFLAVLVVRPQGLFPRTRG